MRATEFITEQGVAEGLDDDDPFELSSDYALHIANAGRMMITQLTNMSKKIQTDTAAAQNAKGWNLGDFMQQHYKTDDLNAINQVFEEYGVGGLFDQNLYELLANWSLQGPEYATTWKQYSGDVIKNSTRKPGNQPVHEQGVAEGQENYNGIDISMEIQKDDEYVDDEDYDNQVLYVTASSKGKELGHVLFAFDGEYLMPQDLEVEERYRGQGIAQTMYDYVKSKGYKIRRSGQQTDAGAGFWDKHKGPGQNVWEQGVAENFADGKGPGRPGDSQRHGIPKHATMAELEKASHAKGRKGQLARWQLNMRRGHKK